MSKVEQILNEEILKKVATGFLNARSVHRKISIEDINNVTHVRYPFLKISMQFDFEFSYDEGSVDTERYQKAELDYTNAYNQYQSAAALKAHAYNSASNNQEKTAVLWSGGPKKPKKPSKDDFLIWTRVSDQTDTHLSEILVPIRPKELPPELKISNDEVFIPEQCLEDVGMAIPKAEISVLIDEGVNAKVGEILKSKVAKIRHKNLQFKILANESKGTVFWRPIWEIAFTDQGKEKHILVDEINGKVYGAMLDESSMWLGIWLKQIILYIALVLFIYENSDYGQFGSMVVALITQPILLLTLSGLSKKFKFLQKISKFLNIYELAKISDIGSPENLKLEKYICDLEDYDEIKDKQLKMKTIATNFNG